MIPYIWYLKTASEGLQWNYLNCVWFLLGNLCLMYLQDVTLTCLYAFLISFYGYHTNVFMQNMFLVPLGWQYSCRFWHRATWIYCSFSKNRRPKVSAEGIILCLSATLLLLLLFKLLLAWWHSMMLPFVAV